MAKSKRAVSSRTPRRSTAKRRPRRRGAQARARAPRRPWGRIAWVVAALGMAGVALYTLYLDVELRERFEGRRWALPARVFARPLELYAGRALEPEALIRELRLLRYRDHKGASAAGEYHRRRHDVQVHTRGFPFWDGEEPGRRLRIAFRKGRVQGIFDAGTGADLALLRLEPVPIASIYPNHNEDRMLVRLADAPQLLVLGLMAVEDRGFDGHHGLDLMAMGRALWANLRAGRTVQGGSTLTQQLIKNFFLSNERSLWRKLNEAIMALLLEAHYDKDEILQAYLNEVYLGQDGRRAIHGFAMASQFYFEKRLQDLSADQIALLVALVKGPSYYDPRQHPQRARARRNLVLGVLARQGLLDADRAKRAQARPLGVSAKAPTGKTPFPAFVQLVRRQLRQDYREQDLSSEGLMIFTTLDPLVQLACERATRERLGELAGRGAAAPGLQTAVVVTDVQNGEVLALVGGRNARYAGYNRALDAQRQVGSLIKPVVFLTALSQPGRYTLASRLDDGPLSLRLANGKRWSPRNYDRTHHGRVLLRDALVHSYNLSTVRLGLDVGVDQVVRTLHDLGVRRRVPEYPSVLLGAVDLSPFEVAQVYQTLASGGYRVPLKAVRGVMNRDGELLRRYPLKIRQVADPGAVFLVDATLHEVTREGTAARLQRLLPQGMKVAGKTGTTNELRDSWFAGFSQDHLAVVWVGRDDNRPTRLTGATGALPIWADIMRGVSQRSLELRPPQDVEWRLIDPGSGLVADGQCKGAKRIPFIKGSAPRDAAPCSGTLAGGVQRTVDWLKALFD